MAGIFGRGGQRTSTSAPRGNNTLDFMGDRLIGAGGFSTIGSGGGGGGSQRPTGPIGASLSGSGGWNPSVQGGGAAGGLGGGPSTFNTSVQQNPQLAAVQGQMQNYSQGLAAGSDADAQAAMARQRDLVSGMAREAHEGVMDRGYSGDSGVAQQARLRALNAGQQAMGGLNASLTANARQQQLAALQGQGNLAATQAGISQNQQNFALNQWQAQQSAQNAATQLQAMQQQNAFNNQMQLAQLYTGF